MEIEEKNSKTIWNIMIIGESKEGVLCMAPNGDSQFLTHSEYEAYLKNRNQRHGVRSFQSDSKGQEQAS